MCINHSWNHHGRYQFTITSLTLLFISCYHNQLSHGFQVTTTTATTNHNSLSSSRLVSPPLSLYATSERDNSKEVEKVQDFDILEVEMENTFDCSNFATTECWGIRPLLMRGAFRSQSELLLASLDKGDDDNDDDNDDDRDDDNDDDNDGNGFPLLWPSWDEVMELALEEDAESRLITHVPNDPLSWRLTLGPFEEEDLESLDSSSSSSSDNLIDQDEKWTMVFNDVDRFHPPLFDFITEMFDFIPQWRKDDGQISLSNAGGGIGPHTDDYDVFLIQMAGKRRWDIGKRKISTKEELQNLCEGLDVRVLNFWEDEVQSGLVNSFTLEPGDVMYLPPRVAHCGTALSDGCMTLSVGLRAPSAKEMMAKLTEYVDGIEDGDFVKRYTDPDLLTRDDARSNSSSSPTSTPSTLVSINEITKDVKIKSKQLLKEAFQNLLDDDLFFDEFFGKIVTESNRARFNYPLSLYELDDDELENLGQFGDAISCVEAMLCGKAALFAAEGISWSFSTIEEEDTLLYRCRLFVDGKIWDLEVNGSDNIDTDEREKTKDLIAIIATEKELRGEMFSQYVPIPQNFQTVLEDLVSQGYLYGSEI